MSVVPEVEVPTPQQLWKEYISRRQPVLIRGHLTDASWKATEKWTLPYLDETAVTAFVTTRQRSSTNAPFGNGERMSMLFKEFLREAESGNENLYLSAQDAKVDRNGFPELLSLPLTCLSDDICPRPQLIGNLVPQQINIWLGCSKTGSSSGLHHDYHDNLYVLLKGRKHFSLFPPDQAGNMYTYGEIKHVHDNGRIVYHGQGDVNADGSDPVDVSLWERTEKFRSHSNLDNPGTTEESELDAILDRCDEERDDYECSTEASHSPSSASSDGEEHKRKKQKSITKEKDGRAEAALHPPNFSRVDVGLSETVQREAFPDFPGLSNAVECTVLEGQMLYLPAGWFHNVTSFGGEAQERDNVHLALNYWCYPPDNLKADAEGFETPYCSDYWPNVWQLRYQPPNDRDQ